MAKCRVGFQKPTLEIRRQFSFLKCGAAFTTEVLVFQIHRCIRGSSVAFSNPTRYSRQQCFFLKSGTAFAAAVLLFQRRQEFTNLINVCERFRAKA
jgi:hypothetical protein